MEVSVPKEIESEIKFNHIFSTKNPKDAVAGLSSGLKSVCKGVVGGASALVALPILGAHEEGPIGFVKGLGLGLLSAVGMTIAGVGTGVVQIGRGIANTPRAISSKMNEQIWDEEKRIWITYDLKEEYEEMLSTESAQKVALDKVVVDMTMYNEVGVSASASADEIKKAYRKKAMVLHPDKNTNDVNAKEKFQKLGEAYQILSNPQLRAAYDEKGKAGIDKGALMDSAQLFEMIFGSQRFEAFCGELQLLSFKDSIKAVEAEDIQLETMKKAEVKMRTKQKKREIHCAVNLAKLLDSYLADTSEEHISFITAIKSEAKELSATAFGGTLIGVLVSN